jgi:hypothetical protein
MSGTWVSAFVALWVVVLIMLFLQIGLLRRTAGVLERVEGRSGAWSPASMGVPPGASIPDFEAADADGSMFESRSQVGRRAIYLFVEEDCEPCRSLLDDMVQHGSWSMPEVDLISLVEGDLLGLAIPHDLGRVLTQAQDVAEKFGTSATPHAFAVDESGIVVEKSIPNTFEELRALANTLGERSVAQGDAGGR